MMKQKKIAERLKLITLLLAISGVLYFILEATGIIPATPSGPWPLSTLFTLLVLLCCLRVLYCFWSVCTEIGNDNSFSMENAKAFHQMGRTGILSAVVFLGRIISTIVSGFEDVLYLVVPVTLFLFSLVFWILCDSLSLLIRNAYELKAENDLTI